MNITIKHNKITITGTITQPFSKAKLYAANPIDRMSNYSGSGLPFPCSYIAFDNTPNIKHINTPEYGAVFSYPNSFYLKLFLMTCTGLQLSYLISYVSK